MTSRRISVPLAILVVSISASIAFFIFCGRDFPPAMAVHFKMSGVADRYMDRVKFIVLGSFLSFMAPIFIATMVGVLPRMLPPSALNVPNKSYWIAPEHRAEALDNLLWFGLWLAALIEVFMLAVDVVIYRANLAQPPNFGPVSLPFLFAIVVLPVGIVSMVIGLFRAFAIPRANLR